MDWQDQSVLRIEEAGEVLGLSRPSAYAAAKRGDIPTIKIGRRLLVPTARLRAMLGENTDGAHAANADAVSNPSHVGGRDAAYSD